MKRDISRLSGKSFDVLVVGGGIHGAAAAREAAARGFSTALIERDDFGHATSANSLKIIHGGLRYLQHGDLAKFRDSVRARRALLRRFGHLAAPLPCVLPTHGLGLRSRPALAAALLINDLLSIDRNRGVAASCRLPRGRTISKTELMRRAPHLANEQASGGALWYDGIALDTERLVLELVLDAAAAGTAVANRVRAVGFLRGGNRVEGVRARDETSGDEFEIRARVTITAAGPWLDELHRPLAEGFNTTAFAKAINIVVGRPIFGDTAVGVEGSGGARRLFFFVPWRGGTMIGTLYLPHAGPPGVCAVTTSDIEQMVGEVNRIHPAARLRPEEVRFAHVGLLPLEPGCNAQTAVEAGLLKRPRLIDAARELGIEGLIGVVGVKYTTGMTVGARAVDLAAGKLGPGTTRPAGELLPEPGPTAPLKDLAAEILHAVREEMALSLADIVLRRTPLGTFGHPGRAALEACATIAGVELAWDAARRAREIDLVDAEYRRLGAREPL